MNVLSYSPGKLLGRTSGLVATPTDVLTAVTMRTEITLITAQNASVTAATVVVHHAQGSEAYVVPGTAILHAQPAMGGGSSIIFQAQFPGTGIMLEVGDRIGVSVTGDPNCTVSFYGVTESLAIPLRR